MSMTFPGMDPYLEDPATWPGFHSRFIVYLAEHLHALIRPRYAAEIEQRVFIEGPDREIVPDVWIARERAEGRSAGLAMAEGDAPVEVRETYVTILGLRTGRRVVAAIELVSPTNKYAGPVRASYKAKQAEVLASETHLVEIDLLRHGPHVLAVPEWAARARGPHDYLMCVNRAADDRSAYQLYPRTLRQPLLRGRIPLAEGDADARLDLQAVLSRTYEAAGYRDRIAYNRPCPARLSPEDQAWADDLIRRAGPPA